MNPPDLATWPLAAAVGIAALAGLIRGFAGFGSGMLMAPILSLLFGPQETVVIIVTMEILVSLQLISGAIGETDWGFVGPMGAAAALFMPLGSWILISLDAQTVTRGMAVIVLLFVAALVIGWRYEGEKRLPTTMGIGALSGVMMAATSMGNPPVILYMLSSRDDAATNRANIISYFAITQVVLLALLSYLGLVGWKPLMRAAAMMPSYSLAAWIGGRLFRASNETLYRRIALAFLLCAGFIGLLG